MNTQDCILIRTTDNDVEKVTLPPIVLLLFSLQGASRLSTTKSPHPTFIRVLGAIAKNFVLGGKNNYVSNLNMLAT